MCATDNPIVARYLASLRREASHLPPTQRDELVDGITEHIESAYAAGATSPARRGA